MNVGNAVLQVYETGELTVVGLREMPKNHRDATTIHDEILALVAEHECRQLAIDLTGIEFVPSGLLGVLASLKYKGIDVMVYNASDGVRDAIESTNLDQAIRLCEVAV